MSLYDELQRAESEEDVKRVFAKHLKLTEYTEGLIDIKSKEVWFEAKKHSNNTSYETFTQLLHYVQVALNKGDYVPPLLGAIDPQKAALMKASDVVEFLKKKTIKWGKSATQFSPEALDKVSKYIGVHFVEYDLETQSYEFIQAFKHAKDTGEFVLREIKPNNLRQVFDRWVEMIGREIVNFKDESKYALLFFADIMSDGTTATHDNLPAEFIHKNGRPAFSLDGEIYELGNLKSYENFWKIYARPPDKKHRDYLLGRRDSLIPLDERMFKGAFFTPLEIVDKAYDTLNKTLGEDWQQNYFVWDMSCGVGNLETKHSNPRNIFMSTLDQEDVKIMGSSKVCIGATRFQYDYLNDDINDKGEIDYSITNKIPQELQKAIKKGKRILVLMNPPYAEASNTVREDSADNKNKAGVAKTKLAKVATRDLGKASNELYIQFLVRIAKEIPTATIAMFSTLKYVSAPNSEEFRANWNAKYLDGFIVHSRVFDGLRGDFPIGFLIWQTAPRKQKEYAIGRISTEILDDNARPIGRKVFYNLPNERMLNKWIDRPAKNNTPALPLKNAILPATAKPRVKDWSDGAIAFMSCAGNDFQQASTLTSLYSSCFSNGNGFYVTPDNLDKAAMTFTARRIIKPNWINNRDQFFIPTGELTDTFINDCLIWMLFNKSNLTAGADGLEWDDKKWSLVNHFIPFSDAEVNAPDRFKSDFMVQYLAGKKLSSEAEAVMTEGRVLWQAYFSKNYNHKVRDLYKLNRPDVGWYQIRNALKENNKKWDTGQTKFTRLDDSYRTLSDKLRPQVFDLGFLMR